jgi:hypothetical protein
VQSSASAMDTTAQPHLGKASGSANSTVNEKGEADPSFGKDESYFQYYALLSHQAQMLQDTVRTSSYQKAILANAEQCFQGEIESHSNEKTVNADAFQISHRRQSRYR